MTLGEKIKYMRFKKKLTQKEVADILGISQPTYARLESDLQIHLPQKAVLDRLCMLFQVTTEYLIEPEGILSHLPDNIKQFVESPSSAKYVEEAYIKWRYEQIYSHKS